MDAPVLLQRRDDAEAADRLIEALTDRYAVEWHDQAGLLYRITIDDARFPDEAVVRLASVLDEIDRDWPEWFAWRSRPRLP